MADFKHKSTDQLLMSDDDLALMQKYTEAYNNATDEAGRSAAHDAAEQLRAKYGYSGGTDGSSYNKISGTEKIGAQNYTYDADGSIAALREQIMNREPFSYDPTTDPAYSAYKKQYTREANMSAQDALGKAAVMTGGMPSTEAVAASQQARDYQMSQLTDKIPELQQLAYSMYMDDVNADYDKLAMLTESENNAYNRFADQRSYDYGIARDAVEDARYEDELAYQRQQDAIAAANKSTGTGTLKTTDEKPDIDYKQVLAAIERANSGGLPLTAKEKQAYEYWMGEPYDDAEENATGVDDATYRGVRDTVIMMVRSGDKEGAAKKIRAVADQLSDSQWADIQKYLEG